MTVQTIAYGAHTAFLDPIIGSGILVRPLPSEDVQDPFDTSRTVHWTEFASVVSRLDAIGWEPLPDDDDSLMTEGYTVDGREAVALYGREPVVSRPSLEEINSSINELARFAGVKRDLATG